MRFSIWVQKNILVEEILLLEVWVKGWGVQLKVQGIDSYPINMCILYMYDAFNRSLTEILKAVQCNKIIFIEWELFWTIYQNLWGSRIIKRIPVLQLWLIRKGVQNNLCIILARLKIKLTFFWNTYKNMSRICNMHKIIFATKKCRNRTNHYLYVYTIIFVENILNTKIDALFWDFFLLFRQNKFFGVTK